MKPPCVAQYDGRFIMSCRTKRLRVVFRGRLTGKQVNVPATTHNPWTFANVAARLKGPAGETAPVTNSEDGTVSPKET